MKGKIFKLPITEEQPFHQNGIKSRLEYKTIGCITGFLFLTIMVLMVIFVFQSISGINELRQETAALKLKLQSLENKIQELQKSNVIGYIKGEQPTQNQSSPADYIDTYDYNESDYLDENNDSYEHYDDEASNDDNYLQLQSVRTGENYTKDLKDTTDRARRSIDSNSDDPKSTNPNKGDYSETSTPVAQASGRFHTARRSDLMMSDDAEVDDLIRTTSGFSTGGQLDVGEKVFRTGRMRPLPTAHFSGDTSSLILGQHEHFYGNGRLRHPQKKFVNWMERTWVNILGMNRQFLLSDGVLTVRESGLYFIYAQIYYYDDHDMNGFTIYRNGNRDEPILQCITTTHSLERVTKANSCFTAGAEYLYENDSIILEDSSDSRLSIFTPEKSFFGVIKLGDVKIK